MNLLFVWSCMSGFIADAWQALARIPDVQLKIFIEERVNNMTRFDLDETLHGLDYTLINENASSMAYARLDEDAIAFQPDMIFIVGWRRRLPRHFALSRRFNYVSKVLIFDLPFAFTLKKFIAPFVLRSYLRHFVGCFVPKTSAVQYAQWLGFKGGIDGGPKGGLGWIDDRLESVNVRKFDGIAKRRQSLSKWPKRFLYVGRYASEKGVPMLVRAYRRYRLLAVRDGGDVAQLWRLDCCGAGPLARLFENESGVQDLGFVQPSTLPEIMLEHGAFVIASSREAWGAVIAEAAAAGLPIVCTETCGAAMELVKKNGVICKVGDVESMAHAMLRLHRMDDDSLAAMGMRGIALAEPYSSENWALSCLELAEKTRDGWGGRCGRTNP